MDISQFLTDTYQYFANNQIEFWAFIFGLVCVFLNTKENIWAWPVGIIGVALSIYVFWVAKLYGDFGLHIIYVILGFYGWYNWLYGGASQTQLPISYSSTKELSWLLAGVGIGGSVALGWVFQKYTDNQFPYGDAITTVFSLVAQWQLTQKRLENWLVWIFVDVIATYIYYQKGLYLFMAQYFIFLILATMGYFQWKKIYRLQLQEANG